MQNFLQYTNITVDDIVNAINNKLSSDPKFANFRESAIAQTIIELFAGTTDIQLYNLQRRAEESFPDTAKLMSSQILASKMLCYSIQRPIPAEAKIKLKLSGDLSTKNIIAGDIIQIPIYSKFNYDDLDLILKTTFQYTFTSADTAEISSLVQDYEKEIILDDSGKNLFVIEGSQKTKIIEGSTNTQIGQIFQKYKIDDPTFSNKFGSEDYDIPITNIWVGNQKSDENKYLVDRRSLINWETIGLYLKGSPIKVCLIKTSTDQNIEIEFGDAKFSELGANLSATGPETSYDNIYIDYLSTKGLEGNRTGIINEKLNPSFSIYVNGDISKDITSNVEFYFYSNLVGGADMESKEEIKHNAPNIFYTMDRLVSSKDYVNYLKSLTSPIKIKNAIAWGEQEEMIKSTSEPILKLFNVAMFCALGSMYNLQGTVYAPKEKLEDVVFDLDFDEDGIPYQSYWNLFVKETVVNQLKFYETSGTSVNIYGNEIVDPLQSIINQYDNFPMSFELNSIYNANGSNISAKITTSAVSLSTVTSFDDIAARIKTALIDTIDLRGTSATNANWNKKAFVDLDVSWDSDNNRFIIYGGKNDPCCLNYTNTYNTDLTYLLGLDKNSVKVNYTSNDSVISDNLYSLITKINKKSQLTVRNVYVSPIIQKFNLTGNIYVKQLADKEDLHRQIKNAIYKWLDVNADFDTSIYLSNIIEIIEQFPSVLNTDIKLEPYVPYNSTYFFNPSYDSRFEKAIYADEKTTIYWAFQRNIARYLQLAGIVNTDTTTITNVWENLSSFKTKIYENTNPFLRNITERSFFTNLVKGIYNDLPVTNLNGTPFRDSLDFTDVISDIHKDLIYIIRYNMLDSNGNIAPEYKKELINGAEKSTWYKGGASLKNEIVKININTNCLYK